MSSGPYDSSDNHRAVTKNGVDNQQDRDIRYLRELITNIRKDFDEFRKDDARTHSTLLEMVQSIKSDLRAYGMVARVLWALVFVFLTSLGGLVGWGASKMNVITEQVAKVDSRTQSDWSQGKKWGEQLDKDVLRLESEIRDLRGRINKREGK